LILLPRLLHLSCNSCWNCLLLIYQLALLFHQKSCLHLEKFFSFMWMILSFHFQLRLLLHLLHVVHILHKHIALDLEALQYILLQNLAFQALFLEFFLLLSIKKISTLIRTFSKLIYDVFIRTGCSSGSSTGTSFIVFQTYLVSGVGDLITTF